MSEAAVAVQYDRIDFEPLACELSSLESERFSRAKAERFIGIVTVGSEFEVVQETGSNMSLLEALRLAKEGDEEALGMVRMNVKADFIERFIKKGHVSKVTQQIGADGETIQNGQSGRSIQANSLRFASKHPKILPRTRAETRNKFRIEDARRQGLLKDHYVVVPSRPPDDMSEAEMHDAGFFVDTMSIAFQATTETVAQAEATAETENTHEIVTESAFVAGKRHRNAPRHDKELVRRLGERLGIKVGEQTATEGIDRPWLVPKSLMPNGVIDLARMADEIMGTFFGEDRPVEDYAVHLEKCREREHELEPTVDEIVADLLADVDTLQTPLDATQRLHELSEAKLVHRALHDEAIDLTVLGVEAAYYVSAARYYQDLGEFDKVELYMDKAVEAADTNSCPGAGTESNRENSDARKTRGSDTAEDGDCEFPSKECPLCHKKKVHTVVKKLPSGKKYIKGSCGCIKIV